MSARITMAAKKRFQRPLFANFVIFAFFVMIS
jgi:hypothetical protein